MRICERCGREDGWSCTCPEPGQGVLVPSASETPKDVERKVCERSFRLEFSGVDVTTTVTVWCTDAIEAIKLVNEKFGDRVKGLHLVSIN